MSSGEFSRWGRIAFTGTFMALGAPSAPPPGPAGRSEPPSHSFGPEFDDYLQTMFARSLQQARDFVEFVGPEPGSIVIEVGAGAGRIAFDGGLAERLGPSGQLLLTDISGSRLNACIDRAQAFPALPVRVLRAAAEEILVASDTADLVLAVSVLHFTDQDRAIPELARVTKPGGRIAISTGLDFVWSQPWWTALAPVRAALARNGQEYRPFLPTSHELHGRLERAGLNVERYRSFAEETLDFPDVDLAIGFWRQIGLVPLILRDAPAEQHALVQDAFDDELRAMFARTESGERRLHLSLMDIIARKPGG